MKIGLFFLSVLMFFGSSSGAPGDLMLVKFSNIRGTPPKEFVLTDFRATTIMASLQQKSGLVQVQGIEGKRTVIAQSSPNKAEDHSCQPDPKNPMSGFSCQITIGIVGQPRTMNLSQDTVLNITIKGNRLFVKGKGNYKNFDKTYSFDVNVDINTSFRSY